MFYLVEIEPRCFLDARAPVKPRMLEVPPQIPVRGFSLENKQAAGNGAGKRR